VKALTILHASRAAVDPVAGYFAARQPGWRITNILDDGVMRLLRDREWDAAVARLERWAAESESAYGQEAVLVTCSALPVASLLELKARVPVPLIKIDEPMAHEAVRRSGRIGILSTFPATRETTNELLRWAAGGREIEIVEELEAEALTALLAGDAAKHDEMVLAATERFRGRVEVLVLAQVSMARLAKQIEARLGIPVLESLSTSLAYLGANE
jgi:Asp/Glu/hydantoin racemase